MRRKPVPRRFYARDPRVVAVDLLGKLLIHQDPAGGPVGGRIVEVEAYLGEGTDPGSHAYRGMTKRNAVMFGPPGHLYVYFTYGMHWCSNVTCNPRGHGGAVLLRALAPTDGLDAMWARRPKAKRTRDLCSGPARLAQALGLTGAHDGTDLTAGPVRLLDDGTPPPDQPGNSVRIGLSAGKGDDSPWRWWVPGDPNVSRP
ncbi:MAG TPA: DNA-3-methyladenine glycosylase [Acidimicrobiia bacterium]|nr:DNA-3-methyladenine glycosylase [Acidimicrobiia bacterium]